MKRDVEMLEEQNAKLNQETEKDDDDDTAHMKDLLLKFLNNVPMTQDSNEQMLSIVLSILEVSKVDMEKMHETRLSPHIF